MWVVTVATTEPGEIGTERTRHFLTRWGARRYARSVIDAPSVPPDVERRPAGKLPCTAASRPTNEATP